MQKDISNDKVKDSEIFLDLIYNEQFERAIKWLNNKILPLVEQSLAFLEVKLVSGGVKFDSPKFSIEKENHLIKDEDNLIKIQSGKYKWESFVPRGKFVKVNKKESWAHSYKKHALHELKKKFFYRDELVQWILDDLFRKSEFSMEIFGIDTSEESISILKNDKITMYITDYIKRPMYYSEAKIISNFRSKVDRYVFELSNAIYKNKNGNLMWKFFDWFWRHERTTLKDYIQLTEKMGYHLVYKEKTGKNHIHNGEITLKYIRWLYRNKSKDLMDFMSRICPVLI